MHGMQLSDYAVVAGNDEIWATLMQGALHTGHREYAIQRVNIADTLHKGQGMMRWTQDADDAVHPDQRSSHPRGQRPPFCRDQKHGGMATTHVDGSCIEDLVVFARDRRAFNHDPGLGLKLYNINIKRSVALLRPGRTAALASCDDYPNRMLRVGLSNTSMF